MIRVAVLFPSTPDAKFDMDYFKVNHLRLIRSKLGPRGMVRVEMDRGTSGIDHDSPAPYVAVTYLVFKSVASFRTAFTDVREDVLGDLANFTDITPHIQVSEIVG
jgi:uncharacterized protein (TIGR02118 family)